MGLNKAITCPHCHANSKHGRRTLSITREHSDCVFCCRPLGGAALDTAAVTFLQAHKQTTRASKIARRFGSAVPAAFLLTLRAGMLRFERPFWEMILLLPEYWPMPVEWVGLCLHLLIDLLVSSRQCYILFDVCV